VELTKHVILLIIVLAWKDILVLIVTFGVVLELTGQIQVLFVEEDMEIAPVQILVLVMRQLILDQIAMFGVVLEN